MADDNKKKFGSFVSKIKDVGIARSSHFFIEMPPPLFLLQDADQSRIDMINLFCQQAEFPDMTINTTPVVVDGLERQAVVDKHYGRTSFVFLVDQDMVIRKYFDDWLQLIVATRGGAFAYPIEYTVDTITVHQLNSAREIVYSVKYHDCFPVSMQAMQVSMSMSGGHHSVQVNFAYRWWESVALTSDANLSNVPDDISTFLKNQNNKIVPPGVAQIKSMNSNMRTGNVFGADSIAQNTSIVNGQTFNFN